VLNGISFGIRPVVLHLTLIRVLPNGVQVHRSGQALSQATTSHMTNTICLRVIKYITSKPAQLFSAGTQKYVFANNNRVAGV